MLRILAIGLLHLAERAESVLALSIQFANVEDVSVIWWPPPTPLSMPESMDLYAHCLCLNDAFSGRARHRLQPARFELRGNELSHASR